MKLSDRLATLGAALALAAGAGGAAAQQGHGHEHGHGASALATAKPQRMTMEALHAAGGVPPGWRFTLPAGDPAAGRQAFVDLKCYACHAIAGERFALKPGEAATAGPDLSSVGAHHPREYVAESIVNPSAVVVDGPGYVGGDGRSIMPEFPQMTVAQLSNLVAYLAARGGGETGHAAASHQGAGHPGTGHADGGDVQEQQAGRYRVRLSYATSAAGHAGHHDHATSRTPGRLVALVTDAATGQPVPYLPVRAVIEAVGRPSIGVALGPRLGPEGFRYEGAITLPPGTRRIGLTLGPSTARLLGGEPGAFARPESLTFAWR